MGKNAFRCCPAISGWGIIFTLTTASMVHVHGAIVWNGPPMAFTNVAGSDPTLPENQDRITPNVWITRGAIQGIYNAKTETSFSHFLSPTNTEWANGTTANYSTLSYTDWNDWAKGVNPNPPSTVGVNAVVHLISEDIYLDIKFTSWPVGGGFSYVRSTPTAPATPRLNGTNGFGDGTFHLNFTNAPGYNFTVLAATDLSSTNWLELGQAGYDSAGPGSYEFIDSNAGNQPQQFYRLRWP